MNPQEHTRREEIPQHIGDSAAAPPLNLGFVGESEQQPMGIEGEGGELAEEPLLHGRCKKRPPSPPLPGDSEDDSPKSTTSGDDGDEWFISDSGSEEDDEDCEDQGAYLPFTSDDFPTASSDYDKQVAVLYTTPDINRRGPSPIMLFPAFKTGYHLFGSDYNLADKSEVTVSTDWDCSNKCRCYSTNLIQFIDAKIAGYQHTHPGHAKFFGFIAARDKIKPLRNYVYRRNIDNCEAVSVKRKMGVARLSLNSPARVISMSSRALIEFELHALSEDKTDGDDDLIIEGCTELYNMTASESFIQNQRLYGQRCALDIKYLVLINAMEARVDIELIRVPAHGINLKLLAKTSGFGNVIRLFRGTVMEVGFSASFAVAVEKRNYLDLYIEGSQRDDLTPVQKTRQNEWWQGRFGSCYHAVEDLVAELGDFAAVSVKISWKSYKKKTS